MKNRSAAELGIPIPFPLGIQSGEYGILSSFMPTSTLCPWELKHTPKKRPWVILNHQKMNEKLD